jgi:hypothetical protein
MDPFEIDDEEQEDMEREDVFRDLKTKNENLKYLYFDAYELRHYEIL